MSQLTPSFVSNIDPYVYQTLQGVVGGVVVVQTTKGTVTGKLTTVMPDHIVVESGGSPFFIRIQQIVWVIPRG
ncbi:YuzF family protein [Cytobacillus spongiae]|uniref:YuzF family protein n=1 Tax=Cytobacillus spongiae TaxID=2901381 RepID=UPI001F35EE1F|nr:YuzF family protein [Cytobacillus spongiae]UII56392.1 YuzF family protein [Cytobacillus spongiae]